MRGCQVRSCRTRSFGVAEATVCKEPRSRLNIRRCNDHVDAIRICGELFGSHRILKDEANISDYVNNYGYQSCAYCHGVKFNGSFLSQSKIQRTFMLEDRQQKNFA